MKFVIKTDRPSGGGQSAPRSSSETERVETYQSSGPIKAQIATSSGDVTIGASQTSTVEVTLSVKDPSMAYLLDEASVSFDPNSLHCEG
jgi:hypothetical protein